MILAIFDLDGTITHTDTFVDFIQHATSRKQFYIGIIVLSIPILLYKCRILSTERIKHLIFKYFFKDFDYDKFKELSESYSKDRLPELIKPSASDAIRAHTTQGHRVVIVTASVSLWVRPWCVSQNLDLIATELEIVDNKLTGKFSGKHCYGDAKADLIMKKYNQLKGFSYIYAYGDSPADQFMLNLADEKYYKNFH